MIMMLLLFVLTQELIGAIDGNKAEIYSLLIG